MTSGRCLVGSHCRQGHENIDLLPGINPLSCKWRRNIEARVYSIEGIDGRAVGLLRAVRSAKVDQIRGEPYYLNRLTIVNLSSPDLHELLYRWIV